MAQLITLLTDFGAQDTYVAEVKAVLLRADPAPTLVDLTHEVPAFDIEGGAFQLLRAHSHFPPGTFHLAIVDPGVGSARRAIYVEVGGHHFVGPDNGLLLWAVRACERREGKAARCYEIPSPPDLAPTFHGRDLFAPFLVARLRDPSGELAPCGKMEGRELPHPESGKGEILHIDHYGNAVTSFPVGVAREVRGRLGKRALLSAPSYASIPRGKAAFVRGSHGFWEIACGQASAARRLGVRRGDRVSLSVI